MKPKRGEKKTAMGLWVDQATGALTFKPYDPPIPLSEAWHQFELSYARSLELQLENCTETVTRNRSVIDSCSVVQDDTAHVRYTCREP